MQRLLFVITFGMATLPAPAFAEEPPPAPPASAPSAPSSAGDAPPAAAVPSQGEALATELFDAARELMVAGRYSEASARLTESARLSPKVGTLGKLAECDEKLGRLVAARAHWQQARNLARASADERLSIVEAELARVDALVPKLLLSVSGAAPPGLAIHLDGVAIGASGLGLPLPLDPGQHTVAVTAPGKKPWSASVRMQADGKVTPLDVTPLDVPPLVDASQPAPPGSAEPAAPPPPAGRPPLAIAGLIGAVTGMAGVGIGAWFGGRAQAKLDESNREGCDGDVCTPAAARIRNEARAAGDLSTAMFVSGGALLAGGVVLWLLGSETRRSAPVKDGPPGSGAPVSSLRIGLSPAGFSVKGSF